MTASTRLAAFLCGKGLEGSSRVRPRLEHLARPIVSEPVEAPRVTVAAHHPDAPAAGLHEVRVTKRRHARSLPRAHRLWKDTAA